MGALILKGFGPFMVRSVPFGLPTRAFLQERPTGIDQTGQRHRRDLEIPVAHARAGPAYGAAVSTSRVVQELVDRARDAIRRPSLQWVGGH